MPEREQEQEPEQEQAAACEEVPDPFDHPRENDGDAPYGPEMSMADYHYLERASRTGRW